jgi:hypothetical protein
MDWLLPTTLAGAGLHSVKLRAHVEQHLTNASIRPGQRLNPLLSVCQEPTTLGV